MLVAKKLHSADRENEEGVDIGGVWDSCTIETSEKGQGQEKLAFESVNSFGEMRRDDPE